MSGKGQKIEIFSKNPFKTTLLTEKKLSKSQFGPYSTLFKTFESILMRSLLKIQSKHSLIGHQINLIGVHFELEAFRSQN